MHTHTQFELEKESIHLLNYVLTFLEGVGRGSYFKIRSRRNEKKKKLQIPTNERFYQFNINFLFS